MKGPKRLAYGGRLQHPRTADEPAPNIRNFDPVRFGLWFDADAPTDDGAEFCERRDAHVIWRALQTVRDVFNPRRQRVGQKLRGKRLNGCKTGGEGFRMRPLFVCCASISSISAAPAVLSGALALDFVDIFLDVDYRAHRCLILSKAIRSSSVTATYRARSRIRAANTLRSCMSDRSARRCRQFGFFSAIRPCVRSSWSSASTVARGASTLRCRVS